MPATDDMIRDVMSPSPTGKNVIFVLIYVLPPSPSVNLSYLLSLLI